MTIVNRNPVFLNEVNPRWYKQWCFQLTAGTFADDHKFTSGMLVLDLIGQQESKTLGTIARICKGNFFFACDNVA